MELERQRPNVRFVMPDSAAATAGFERGQIIKKVGQSAVDSSRAAYLAMAEQGLLLGKRIELTLTQGDAAAESEPKTIKIQLLH